MNRYLKDPGSAITHFIGMIMAIFAAIPLLLRAAKEPQPVYLISLGVFSISMILLYAASTAYHTFDLSVKINTVLKKHVPFYPDVFTVVKASGFLFKISESSV